MCFVINLLEYIINIILSSLVMPPCGAKYLFLPLRIIFKDYIINSYQMLPFHMSLIMSSWMEHATASINDTLFFFI
jgi:hypothetical protein